MVSDSLRDGINLKIWNGKSALHIDNPMLNNDKCIASMVVINRVIINSNYSV